MQRKFIALMLVLVPLLTVLMVLSNATAEAAPLMQATATPGGNLLVNGGFETSVTTTGTTGTANWTLWSMSIARPTDGSLNYAYTPKWNQESTSKGAAAQFIFAGSSSQRVINNWDPWWGGVRQTVTAPAGKRVRLTVYVQVWSQSNEYPAASDGAQVAVMAGIDPTGGDNAQASTVVWSGAVAPHGGWQPIQVEAVVGTAGKATVFISTDYRGSSRKYLAAFFDEASLVQVTNPKPTATPTPVINYTNSTTYTVQKGDSLSRIAQRFGVKYADFLAINGFKDSSLIVPGQVVRLPGGAYPIYVVQKGDSLSKIAKRFNVKYSDLLRANRISDPNLIYVGQKLAIPVK